eukprot:31542-Pelagococcus_subviridis.AAC.16
MDEDDALSPACTRASSFHPTFRAVDRGDDASRIAGPEMAPSSAILDGSSLGRIGTTRCRGADGRCVCVAPRELARSRSVEDASFAAALDASAAKYASDIGRACVASIVSRVGGGDGSGGSGYGWAFAIVASPDPLSPASTNSTCATTSPLAVGARLNSSASIPGMTNPIAPEGKGCAPPAGVTRSRKEGKRFHPSVGFFFCVLKV